MPGSTNYCLRWCGPGSAAGTDIALIADTAHIMFEGLLGSTIPRDRPFEEIVQFLIEMLVAAAPQAARRQARPAGNRRHHF